MKHVKPKRTFSWFLERGMLYLYLIYLIFFYSIIGFYPEGYQLNRTIGWFWDITGLRFYFPVVLLVYLLGFIVIVLFKCKAPKLVSLLFLINLIFGVLMNVLELPEMEIFFYIISIVLFVILFFKSMFSKIFK